MTYWFRLGGHPDGPLPHHEFARDGDLVYPRAVGHSATSDPWFTILRNLVYATVHHPDGGGDEPWYEIVGSFVYPAHGHPDGRRSEPRYQVRSSPA
jgi:hypothetical protein